MIAGQVRQRGGEWGPCDTGRKTRSGSAACRSRAPTRGKRCSPPAGTAIRRRARAGARSGAGGGAAGHASRRHRAYCAHADVTDHDRQRSSGRAGAIARVREGVDPAAQRRSRCSSRGRAASARKLVARAIHRSARGERRFGDVNCAALPDELLEPSCSDMRAARLPARCPTARGCSKRPTAVRRPSRRSPRTSRRAPRRSCCVCCSSRRLAAGGNRQSPHRRARGERRQS